MKMIVGLGNPGKEYELTRHNAGFMFLDFMARQQGCSWQKKTKFKSEIAEFKAKSTVILVKPQTFMNASGSAVSKIVSFYKFDPRDIILIHDDLDIRLGAFKMQAGKGPKVHNGVNSVEEALGNDAFLRVRLGVDNRASRIMPGESYVLSDFSAQEIEALNSSFMQIYNDLIARL